MHHSHLVKGCENHSDPAGPDLYCLNPKRLIGIQSHACSEYRMGGSVPQLPAIKILQSRPLACCIKHTVNHAAEE